jgi:hypothetical protein
MAYSTEDNVYEATGMSNEVIRNLSGKTEAQVTTLVQDFIAKADDRIKRLMKIPITIRKERHIFDKNYTEELGPDQDDFEVFDYDPANCVEAIYALYTNKKRRIKLPYPRDCDSKTEAHTDYTSSNCVLTTESSDKKCGDASIKGVFSDAGYFGFPANADLNKNIYPWDYMGFWFKTSDSTATFTVRIYDIDGNYDEKTFTLEKNGIWYVVGLDMSDFTSNVAWSEKKCYEVRIYSDIACTVYFDNWSLNQGFFWTYPEGLLVWSKDQSDEYPNETVYITYSYDPYLNTAPEVVKQASAKLAGVYLLDYLIGIRIRTVGFEAMSESLEFDAEREVLVSHRTKLQKEAEELIATIGYGTHQGIG